MRSTLTTDAAATHTVWQRPDVEAAGLPYVEDAGRVAPMDARAMSRVFLDRLRALEEGTDEYQYVRNTLIELNLSLVNFAAQRFRNRSEPHEDIVQVGTIGLIKAIDRFDLSREVEFTTFAVPYIVGEMKRFFRDTSWSVHVPRRLQELRLQLAKTTESLSRELGRAPSHAEIGGQLGISVEDVVEGEIAANGYTAGSLDIQMEDEDGTGSSFAARLGQWDTDMLLVENLRALQPLLAELDDRSRAILEMRFGQEMTQSEIGVELGVSQMHVSRLLARVLGDLREGLLAES